MIKDYMTDSEMRYLMGQDDDTIEQFYLDVKYMLPTEGIYEAIGQALINIKERN